MHSLHVETLARNYLVNELIRVGFEVAQPLHDRGIDLLIYEQGQTTLRAWPVQLKAHLDEGFSIDRKYADIPGLLFVHAWHLDSGAVAEFYCLTYSAAEQIADSMGWSWRDDGRWIVTRPSRRLRLLLQPYQASADLWRARIDGASASTQAHA